MKRCSWLCYCLPLAIVLTALSSPSLAAERKARPKPGQYNADHESVELFAAIEAGQIEAKFIPKDSTGGRVFITNKTKKPLNVGLPEVFAGVPVLAQVGGFGAGAGGFGAGAGLGAGGQLGGAGLGGGSQGLGGGFGGMGGMGGMGMGGMGGGFFNVAAEKVGEIKVATVCLEHGKPDPRPSIPYAIRPLESFNDDPAVAEMLKLFAQGKINQRAAQAAAWHLANGMSWQQLAAKRIEHLNGVWQPWFNPAELHVGMQLATAAQQAAESKPKKSPGETSPGELTAAN
jgi:hypothetical protein